MRRSCVAALVLAVLGAASPASADTGGNTDLLDRIDRVTAVARRPLDPQLSPSAFRIRAERRLALVDETLALVGFLPEDELEAVAPVLARVPAERSDQTLDQMPGLGLVADDGAGLAELQAHIDRAARLRVAIADLREAGDHLRVAIGLLTVGDDVGRSCPVDGPVFFEDTWGAGRGWRTHKGVDMIADSGTPLVAVESGVVVQAGWHWAGGIGLYLVGDESRDVFYYAHMDDIAPDITAGTPVEEGTLLGWVGATGNAGLPHLHLGWMPGAGRVDLTGLDNSYDLMASLCW